MDPIGPDTSRCVPRLRPGTTPFHGDPEPGPARTCRRQVLACARLSPRCAHSVHPGGARRGPGPLRLPTVLRTCAAFGLARARPLRGRSPPSAVPGGTRARCALDPDAPSSAARPPPHRGNPWDLDSCVVRCRVRRTSRGFALRVRCRGRTALDLERGLRPRRVFLRASAQKIAVCSPPPTAAAPQPGTPRRTARRPPRCRARACSERVMFRGLHASLSATALRARMEPPRRETCALRTKDSTCLQLRCAFREQRARGAAE